MDVGYKRLEMGIGMLGVLYKEVGTLSYHGSRCLATRRIGRGR